MSKVKSSSKKNTKNTKVESVEKEVIKEIDDVVELKKEEQEISKPTRKVKQQINKNEEVACRSVTFGGLTYISKRTGMEYYWSNYGDVVWIEYGELLNMKASSPNFLTKPRFIIDDEEVVEALGLTDTYKKIIAPDELEDLFKQGAQVLEEKLRIAPEGIKELIILKASQMIKDGTLYNINIIKTIEKVLKTDLQVFIE